MFRKYPHIENFDYKAYIEKFLKVFPQLHNESYAIYEKIDGTNIQILVQPHEKDILIGSRYGWISAEQDHHGAYHFFSNLNWDGVHRYCNQHEKTVRIIIEYYGKGILDVINYGEEQYFAVLDIEENDTFLSSEICEVVAKVMQIDQWLVRPIAIVHSLEEALQFNCTFQTKFSHTDYAENKGKPFQYEAEGIVIKPYRSQYSIKIQHPNGDTSTEFFLLKKKPKRRQEKARKNGSKVRTERVIDDDVQQYQSEFEQYITENRFLNIISKNGKPQSKSEIGKYIALMIADAKEDFLKEFPDASTKSNADWKIITSTSSPSILPFINKYMEAK